MPLLARESVVLRRDLDPEPGSLGAHQGGTAELWWFGVRSPAPGPPRTRSQVVEESDPPGGRMPRVEEPQWAVPVVWPP